MRSRFELVKASNAGAGAGSDDEEGGIPALPQWQAILANMLAMNGGQLPH